MISVQYIVLHVLLVLITYMSCKKIKFQSSHKYWQYAMWAIIAFTLEEGLRWGRMIDWCMYYESYASILNETDYTMEPVFRIVWSIFAILHVPYWGIISFMSFLFIVSAFYFCKPYRNVLPYVMPLLVVTAGYFAENLIRWYMSYSFLLIALRHYLDGKKKNALFWVVISVLSHYAMILSVFLMLLIDYFKKKMLHPFVAIALSVLFVSLMSYYKDLMMNLLFIANLFSSSERFGHYSEDASDWFVVQDANPFMSIVMMVPLYFALWVVNKKMNNSHLGCFVYNCFVVSLLIKSLGQDLELALRYRAIFDPFVCMLMGMVCYSSGLFIKKINISKAIMVVYLLLQTIHFVTPLPNEKLNMYVWNDTKSAYELLGVHKGWWK